MSFRFWRRIRIAPGVTLNLSKSGGSLSFGPRGAKFTLGPRGNRTTVGIPGTGLFYTTHSSGKKPAKTGKAHSTAQNASPQRAKGKLTLGFFKRLVTPDDEEALVDGCRELVCENYDEAFAHLEKSIHLADGAYIAGFLALKKEMPEKATDYLSKALGKKGNLGKYFSKYGIGAEMTLPVTNEITAHIEADAKGVMLGLVEAYQQLQRYDEAKNLLSKLSALTPNDVLVQLSLCELLFDAENGSKAVCKQIVKIASETENESAIPCALLYYKAKALRHLELLTAARDLLTSTLRRKKGRSEELLRALRYERALVYVELGEKKRSLTEFEKIYSDAPDYEDVGKRLGL